MTVRRGCHYQHSSPSRLTPNCSDTHVRSLTASVRALAWEKKALWFYNKQCVFDLNLNLFCFLVGVCGFMWPPVGLWVAAGAWGVGRGSFRCFSWKSISASLLKSPCCYNAHVHVCTSQSSSDLWLCGVSCNCAISWEPLAFLGKWHSYVALIHGCGMMIGCHNSWLVIQYTDVLFRSSDIA